MSGWRSYRFDGAAPSAVTPPTLPPVVAEPVRPVLHIPAMRPGLSLAETQDYLRTQLDRIERSINETRAWQTRTLKESILLDLAGTTTDTLNDLLPANSRIIVVYVKVTEAITGATTLAVGDATDDDRFKAATAVPAVGQSLVCLRHHTISGEVQEADAPIRLTGDLTATDGAVEITVYFELFTAPSA